MSIASLTFPTSAPPEYAGRTFELEPANNLANSLILTDLEPVLTEPLTFERALNGRIPDNDPRNLFASVVNGRGDTIAQVFNSGVTTLTSDVARNIDLEGGRGGLDLARTRLDQLVTSTGGRAIYADQTPPGFHAQVFFNTLIGTGG